MKQTISEQIHKMDSQELNFVIDMVKSRRQTLSRIAKDEFKIGDEVGFDAGSRGGWYTGLVTKINRTKIVIDNVWTVPPTMLQHI